MRTVTSVTDIDGQVLIKYTNTSGSILFKNKIGQWHRLGGPAYVEEDGTQEYWVNDQKHNSEGPATIYPDGSQFYWVNNKKHRLDGPAYIGSDGTKQYYVNNIEYTKEEYPQAVLEYKLKQLVG